MERIKTHDAVYKRIKELMALREMMSGDFLSAKKAERKLSRLESAVEKVHKAMASSVRMMKSFEEEFAEALAQYEQALAGLKQDMPFDAMFGLRKDEMPAEQRENRNRLLQTSFSARHLSPVACRGEGKAAETGVAAIS